MSDYGVILQRIEAAGIPTCVLHGWEESARLPGSDLDIAVRPENLAALSRLLALQEDFSCVQLLPHESSCYYFVLARDAGPSDRFLRLDVAADYRRNGRIFLTADELFRDRRKKGPIWVSSPTVELPYLLIKKILKGDIPPHQGSRLRSLLAELGPEGEGIVRGLLGDEAGSSVLRWISGGHWHALTDALPRLRRTLLRITLWRSPIGAARYLVSDARRFASRLLQPTGLWVAVMGPDGVGKSTLIARMRDEMSGAFRGSRLFHLRPGVLASRRSGGDPSRPHAVPPYAGAVAFLKLAYLVVDFVLGFLLRVRPALVRSSLVLFDRYFDDMLADARRYRFSRPGWSLHVARRFVPRPDVYLFLDAAEDVLLARKPELPAAELRRQRSAYRRMAAGLPNAVMLDGSRSADDVARDAVESLLLFLKERYAARRTSLFPGGGGDSLLPLFNGLFRAMDERRQSASAAAPRSSTRSFALLSLADGRGFLIPTEPRRAASGSLRIYSAQAARARAARAFLAAALRAGIVPPSLPRITQEGTRMSGLLERIEGLIGERGLRFAVSLGTPGAHRKPVIQALDSMGTTRGFAKVGWDAETTEIVRNEARTLEGLARASPGTFTWPAPVYVGAWEGLFLLVMAPPPPALRNVSWKITRHSLDILAEMSGLQRTPRPLQESAFWRQIEERARRAATSRERWILARGARYLSACWARRHVSFHFAHGDYTPWNMLRSHQSIFLFDWEYAHGEFPAGYDLFHFVVQTGLLLRRQRPMAVYESLFGAAAGTNGNRRAIAGLLGGLESAVPLLLLYVMDRLAFHALRPDVHSDTLARLSALAGLCMDGEA